MVQNQYAKDDPEREYCFGDSSQGGSLVSDTRGKHGKPMRREFDEMLYHERDKTETVSSVIKRKLDSEIKSYSDAMKTRELLHRVLACNCHRIRVISCFVSVMISRKPRIEDVDITVNTWKKLKKIQKKK